MGDPQILHRCTIGGSLAHADPAADLPMALVALGGSVDVLGQGGTRNVAAENFFAGYFETAMEPGELIAAARVPRRPGAAWGYQKFVRRANDWAIVGVAAEGQFDLVSDSRRDGLLDCCWIKKANECGADVPSMNCLGDDGSVRWRSTADIVTDIQQANRLRGGFGEIERSFHIDQIGHEIAAMLHDVIRHLIGKLLGELRIIVRHRDHRRAHLGDIRIWKSHDDAIAEHTR